MLSTFKKDKSSDHSSIQPPKTECFVYDLYAVCNHHGDDLQGGHYTATCRNPTDGQWYTFDDMHTNKVEENEVVTLDAYILFYQRQSLTSNPSSSASSSASSSTTSGSGQEHWVYRMPDFNYKNKTNSNLSKAQQQANVRAVTTNGNTNNSSAFTRNKGSYATMPVKSESSMEIKNPASTTNEEASEKPDDDNKKVTETETKSLNGEISVTTSSSSSSSTSDTNEIDDVSRPIDKNDVD